MKKAFSTEQLPQTDNERPGLTRKLEPIPPQVVRKLEARERAWVEASGGTPGPKGGGTRQPEAKRKQLDGSAQKGGGEGGGGSGGEGSVTKETAPAHQLPQQQQQLPPPTAPSLSIDTT